MHNKLPFISAAFAVLLGIASTAFGGIPPLQVTVFDPGGKVAFEGPIGAAATFSTGNLHPGAYVVRFHTKSAAVKANQYLLVLSAGKQKVIAAAVPGEIFILGGAAMKINVGPGLKITGQIAKEETAARNDVIRSLNGKRYVWMTTEIGSNLGGRWIEQGVPPAANVGLWPTDEIRKSQDRAGEGSMIPSIHRHPEYRGGY